MKPHNSPSTTRILGAPVDWNIEKMGECAGLPIIDSNGVMYSFWNLSLKERILLLFGWPILLSVVGTNHPPVAINVGER